MAAFCALLAAAGYAIFLGACGVCVVANHLGDRPILCFHVSSFGEQNDRLLRTIFPDHRFLCRSSLPRHMAGEQRTTTLPPCDGGRVLRVYDQRRWHRVHVALQ